ncbi:hypothetical protein [Novosphingobium sp.]|uniref:hypothetical protein n=1 Tax=Novosphingobium sp. TaxID=1874826 RepID=UPI00261EED50|nr:hypothetical protein [Novosphingobium sp.]
MASGALLLEMSTIDARVTDKVAAACPARDVAFDNSPIGRRASPSIWRTRT